MRFAYILAVPLLITASLSAYAAGPDVVAVRKANFKEIGGAFKAINDEIKSGSPDMNSVRPVARDLAARAAASLKHFPAGSGPQAGRKTRSKAAIWTQGKEFAALQQQFAAQTSALAAATAGGNLAAMTAAKNAVGGTCKSCHDKFREPE